jgi:hypothetical protein
VLTNLQLFSFRCIVAMMRSADNWAQEWQIQKVSCTQAYKRGSLGSGVAVESAESASTGRFGGFLALQRSLDRSIAAEPATGSPELFTQFFGAFQAVHITPFKEAALFRSLHFCLLSPIQHAPFGWFPRLHPEHFWPLSFPHTPEPKKPQECGGKTKK